MTFDLNSKVAEWRAKAARGELTIDEMRDAIAHMRQGSKSAAVASDKARKSKAVAAIPDADSLLAELGGL